MKSRTTFWLLTIVFLGALALRAPHLGLRPMHGDEAVHADKFNTLWTSGQYVYDAREYHGPTIYDFALPIVQLSGAQNLAEVSSDILRLVPLLFGVSLVGLLWLCRDGFGVRRDGLIWAAIFIALSPLMVFYSRYFIQEMALVAFSFAAFACLWRAYRGEKVKQRNVWIICGGASLGLMFASKETAILAVVCALFSLLLTSQIAKRWKMETPVGTRFSPRETLIFFGVAAFVAGLFLSNFGRNPRGAWDGIAAFATYFSRAGAERGGEVQGALHDHPWFQYFAWLLWYRPAPGPRWTEIFPFALAIVALFSLWRRPNLTIVPREDAERHLQVLAGAIWLRLVAIYALSLAIVYALIPYKTPWCALGFWHPFLILAGIGASYLIGFPAQLQVLAKRVVPRVALQVLAAVVLLLGSVQLGMQSWASNTKFFADRRNPWVYAHPVPDVDRLGERVLQLAPFSSQKQQMPVLTIASGGDYWPLPWQLRALPNAGFFGEVPANLKQFEAPVIIVSQAQRDEVAKRLGPNFETKYQSEFYGLRPKVTMILLVENSLWQRFLKTR